jgi:hypothetical protein
LFFMGNTMDWDSAIKRNSEALKGIVADLFAMLGLAGSDAAARLPRSVHTAVLRVLRPAESAVRRLIVIAARGLVVKLKPVASRPMPKLVGPIGKSGGQSHPSFQLFDQRKNFKAMFSEMMMPGGIIPRWPHCGQRADPWPSPLLRRRPMALWVPNVSPAGSRPSSWPLRICRARPGVSPAGG